MNRHVGATTRRRGMRAYAFTFSEVPSVLCILGIASAVVLTCGNYSLTISVSQDTGEISVD